MFVVNGPLSHMTFFVLLLTLKKPEVVASLTKRTVAPVVERKEETKEDVPVIPLTWGSGRSFADVLKKEEASS
jgi:hypothetical protein